MTQELFLANDLFKCFQHKRITCRAGRRDIKLEELTFVSTDPVDPLKVDWIMFNEESRMIQDVRVTCVKYIRVGDMSHEDAIADGFNGVEDLLNGMRRFYPDLSWDSEVTLIYFDVL